MSVHITEEEKREALDFLRRFVADRPNAFGEGEVLPIRVNQPPITASELEGECIDWCLQFLNKRLALVLNTAVLA